MYEWWIEIFDNSFAKIFCNIPKLLLSYKIYKFRNFKNQPCYMMSRFFALFLCVSALEKWLMKQETEIQGFHIYRYIGYRLRWERVTCCRRLRRGVLFQCERGPRKWPALPVSKPRLRHLENNFSMISTNLHYNK